MIELARALVARGHRVTLYAHRIDDEALSREITFRRVPRLPVPTALDNVALLLANSVLMRRGHHDVACTIGPTGLPRHPFVYNAQFSHRGWQQSWDIETQPARRHRLHSRLTGALETFCVSRAERLIVSAPRLAEEILDGRTVPTSIVPNGVDLEQYPPVIAEERAAQRRQFGLAPDRFVIGFLGEYRTTRKGLRPLLEAIAAGRADEQLLVAAPGDAKDLEARAVELGITDRVVVPGFAPASEVMAAADCVCVPSFYEPFSLVALEAAARGVPVVVSALAGAAALLEGAAVIVENPRDPASLRRAIDEVRRDAEMTRKRVESARRIAEGLSWQSVMAGAAEVIEAVAGSARR
jgi:glycosyltransferase involved in cell wall biosynthesis